MLETNCALRQCFSFQLCAENLQEVQFGLYVKAKVEARTRFVGFTFSATR
jgi:hypothetical protein